MSFSRILFFADELAQANRLALLLSRYGHEPVPLAARDPWSQLEGADGLMLDCKRLTAEWRLLATTLAGRGLPVVLFAEALPDHLQQQLLAVGVTLVPHKLGDKEPVEAWIKLARTQQGARAQHQQRVVELEQKLAERKWVERAKGVLMKQHGLDEESAYKALRSAAMQHSLSLGELARRLLAKQEQDAE